MDLPNSPNPNRQLTRNCGFEFGQRLVAGPALDMDAGLSSKAPQVGSRRDANGAEGVVAGLPESVRNHQDPVVATMAAKSMHIRTRAHMKTAVNCTSDVKAKQTRPYPHIAYVSPRHPKGTP